MFGTKISIVATSPLTFSTDEERTQYAETVTRIVEGHMAYDVEVTVGDQVEYSVAAPVADAATEPATATATVEG